MMACAERVDVNQSPRTVFTQATEGSLCILVESFEDLEPTHKQLDPAIENFGLEVSRAEIDWHRFGTNDIARARDRRQGM